ncbi:hypothetical protein ACSBR2_016600 [Camellia fascicularis]
MERKEIHVVLLPWLAFGHMMPFHELAISLAKAGIKVSYISTPNNLRRLPTPPPPLAGLITPVALPLPPLDLPENAEATVDIPMEKLLSLTMAFDLLHRPFKQFVSDHSPDWIISDFIPHWTSDVARDLGVPLLTFSAFSAATNVFFGPPEFLSGEGQKRVRSSIESLTSPPEWVTFPSAVAYRRFEAAGALFGFFGDNPTGISAAGRVGKTLEGSSAVAIRSCREIEGEYLSLFEQIIGKPVIPVGLLPPLKSNKAQKQTRDENWTQIFKWLDYQKPRSVLFVGFGSECKLNKEEIHEIAHGLEKSELPFLWALRKPTWAIEDLDSVPIEFTDRTLERGRVSFGWAPQREILEHPSIGGSLFHAGWGSVIETLQFGHSMVVLPLIIDQGLNARLMVEKGLAIEVERSEDGSFSRDDIAKALKLAMVSKEGDEMRARLREAAKMAGDQKLHDGYMDEFVKYLKNGAVIANKN